MKCGFLLQQALLLLVGALAVRPALAQPLPLSGPSPGILALENGQVISGKIIRDGDRYVVTLGESATLRIPVSSVEFHGNSLRQVYQYKEAAVLASDINGQLRLTQWCIRHGLLAEAEAILLRNATNHNLPQWNDLQRRLALAKRPTRTKPRPGRTGGTSQSSPDMEQVLKNVSASSFQEFTSFIQPLLLNRCSTTTCHGALSKTPLKIIRPPHGRAIPTRYTQRNLFNTWQTLDPKDPDKSPLINITTAPHGGTDTLFTQREWDQYQRLVTWVRRITKNGPVTMPNEINLPGTVLTQPVVAPEAKVPTPQETDLQRAASVEALLNAPVLPPQKKEPGSTARPPKQLPGSRDPFDPDVFNRKFHGTRFASPNKSAPVPSKSKRPEPKKSEPSDSSVQKR